MKRAMGEDADGPSVSKHPDRSTQFLANERTFLAWLRTSVAIIGLGFVVARFSLFLREFELVTLGRSPTPSLSGLNPTDAGMHSPSSIVGLSMVALGILLVLYALFNYKKAHDIIERGGEYISKHSIMYIASLGLVAFGIIVIVYLLLISV